jgi:universal stress protein E
MCVLKLMDAVVCDLEADEYNYLKPQSHFLKGRARKEIPLLAKKLEADLIVMGTVASLL